MLKQQQSLIYSWGYNNYYQQHAEICIYVCVDMTTTDHFSCNFNKNVRT